MMMRLSFRPQPNRRPEVGVADSLMCGHGGDPGGGEPGKQHVVAT